MDKQKTCTQTLSDLYMKIKMYGQQIRITIPQQIPNFGPHRQYIHTFHRHTYSMMYTSSLRYIYVDNKERAHMLLTGTLPNLTPRLMYSGTHTLSDVYLTIQMYIVTKELAPCSQYVDKLDPRH